MEDATKLKSIKEFVIRIRKDPEEPTRDVWLAECEDGSLGLFTYGNSPADALEMLAEVFKLGFDECKTPGEPHCWCRSAIIAGVEDIPIPAQQCCLCETRRRRE